MYFKGLGWAGLRWAEFPFSYQHVDRELQLVNNNKK